MAYRHYFLLKKSNQTLAIVFRLCVKNWYFPIGVLSHFVPGQVVVLYPIGIILLLTKSNQTLAAMFNYALSWWCSIPHRVVGVLSHFASYISCSVGFLTITCPIALSCRPYNTLIASSLKSTFFLLTIA